MQSPLEILADEIVRAFDDRETAKIADPFTTASGETDRHSRRTHFVRFPSVRGLPRGVAMIEVDGADCPRVEDVTILWNPHFRPGPDAPNVAAADVELRVQDALRNHPSL